MSLTLTILSMIAAWMAVALAMLWGMLWGMLRIARPHQSYAKDIFVPDVTRKRSPIHRSMSLSASSS
ncbi:hypothetical protein ORL50_27795 [Pseudomonas mandelii]|nr:hypothetical protein [Pseudomonas mandelii]MCX2901538.1 hypothetical protein [Pseudomonas mandelii]